MKKIIGKLMSMMSVLVVGSGAASVAGIGTEEMPNALKAKR
ncbi:hypothetical protein [Romboutsia weinsteinii]|nr:hypothetical protein [Romboutsia weinsteinii]